MKKRIITFKSEFGNEIRRHMNEWIINQQTRIISDEAKKNEEKREKQYSHMINELQRPSLPRATQN